jgi:adenylate cyclase
MPRVTIRFALIALLLAAIVPTATGISVSAYLNSRATIELLWQDLADEMVEDARQKTLRFLESGASQLRLTRLLTEDELVDPQEPEAALRYLHRCLLAHPNITWCSYGGVDGVYLAAYREPDGRLRLTQREQETKGTRYRDYRVAKDGSYTPILDEIGDFDPRKRPWWPVGLEAAEPRWAEPFLFASRRQPGVVLTLRQDGADGKPAGVWLAEYELSEIADYLRGIKESARTLGGPQSHADVYIVSGQGYVVGDPEGRTSEDSEDGPRLIAAESHPDEKLAAAYREARAEGLGTRRHFQLDLDGERYLAVTAPVADDGNPDWTMLIAVPAMALLGPIYENNRIAAIIAALVALASVLLGVLLAERLVRALRGVASDLDRIGRLEFPEAPTGQKSFIREIAAMLAARDRMTGGLRSFGKYVPAGLVRKLIERGQVAALGGETRELSIFFADIADFTSFAEMISPQELVDQLGAYLGEMSGAIQSEGGTVDKFIGDAIMAFWGAPEPVEDHALAACKAALDCQARLAGLRNDWIEAERPALFARIGINTGQVLVGNIGSDERMNYTAMGDAVNVASRLERQCKRFMLPILIGERTRALAGESIVARPLDKLAVRGKEEGLIVYELLSLRENASADDLRLEALGQEAVAAYLAADFARAAKACRKVLEILPGDVAAQELLSRAERPKSGEPPEDWDGVLALSEK